VTDPFLVVEGTRKPPGLDVSITTTFEVWLELKL